MPYLKKSRGPKLRPSNLAEWQRTLYAVVTRPLATGDQIQTRWFDGGSSARALARLIRPSATLRPIERAAIYNRMYWFRLLECIATDFPGLRTLLGDERFWRLAENYLRANPSRSYTLRNLGKKLPNYILREPKWTRPFTAAARDLARFEWAQIIAFDEGALPRLTKRVLARRDPHGLRLRLQPYVTLLTCQHAVDEYVLAVKDDRALRAEASHAVGGKPKGSEGSVALRRTGVLHVVVHRADNQLYYKRIEPRAALLLRALAAGETLPEACARAFKTSELPADAQAEKVRDWFSLWMRLGWLCQR
jgi:hypothetical protein